MPLLKWAVQEIVVLGYLHLALAKLVFLEDVVVRGLMGAIARDWRMIDLALFLTERLEHLLRVTLSDSLEAMR